MVTPHGSEGEMGILHGGRFISVHAVTCATESESPSMGVYVMAPSDSVGDCVTWRSLFWVCLREYSARCLEVLLLFPMNYLERAPATSWRAEIQEGGAIHGTYLFISEILKV